MKLDNIQIGRGIAAIVVVIHHLFLPQIQMVYKNLMIFKVFNFNVLGDFAVYFFFCISGFVMMLSCTNKHKTVFSFIKDRVIRIFPLYIICTVCSLCIYFCTRNEWAWLINLNFIPHSIYEYISALLLFPPLWNGESFAMPLATAWSLVYEMYYYMCFATLLAIMNIRKIPWILLGFFFVSFVIVNSIFEPSRHRWVYWLYIISDFANICFAIGAILFLVPKDKRLHKKTSILMLVSILLCILLLPAVYYENITLPLMASICFYLLLSLKPKRNTITSMLVYLGNASYSIYLTHVIFNSLSWQAIKINPLVGLAFTIFAIVFGCIVHELLEKPLLNLFRDKHKKVTVMLPTY
ncbi:acyltransferase, partial [Escherichia coli]|uniref:acyltransferase family protein n=1 Tax=Escherichia coli TaxID=562 RepID=UPI0018DD4488